MKNMKVPVALALPNGLTVTEIEMIDEVLTLTAVSMQMSPCCPLCGVHASRVHSHYTRKLTDLPCGGQRVCLFVCVRKLFCEVSTCAQKIFAERLTPFAQPWARVTLRLYQIVQVLGLATGGRLGVRVTDRLGIQTCRTTILRRIMALPTEPVGKVVELGIDDFAFRRGRKYGTILVDMVSRNVVDLLPNRTVETSAAWMDSHPEITLVSRDRGGDYAAAARTGAPQATQVADRFHLAKNLAEAVETTLARIRPEIRQVIQSEESPPPDGEDFVSADWKPKAEPDEQEVCLARQAERQDRYQQMMQWYEQGLATSDIAHRLGVTTRTVQNWIKKGIPYEKPRRKRQSCFDSYADTAIALLQGGLPSSLQVWHALRAQGFKGSYRVVHRFLETLPEYVKQRVGNVELSKTIPKHPLHDFHSQKAVWWFMCDSHDLEETEQSTLQVLLQACPTASTLYRLTQEFLSLLRQRKGELLDAWIEKVKESQINELCRLVNSIERDKAAVLAGLTLHQNNGLVEGKVNKLKLIKRMGYGRAEFPLLRQRVLHAL